MAPMATTAGLPPLELESDSGETFPVVDPATGETIAEVPRMGAAETRRAVERVGEEGKRVYGDTIPTFAADRRVVVVEESDIGREGSKYGIDERLEIKYPCMGGV